MRMIQTLTPALFAKITAGFDGEIRYIRLSRRCLIAWHAPASKGG